MTARAKSGASMGWLWPLLRPQRRRIGFGSLSVAVQAGVGLLTPYLFKIAIDRAVIPRNLAVLNVLALVYIGLAGLGLLAARAEILAVGQVGQHTLHAVRCRLFAHVQRLPLEFYQREQSGGVVSRLVGDVETLTGLVSDGLMQLVSNAATLAGIMVVLGILDWRLALQTLAITPVLAVAAVQFQRRSTAAWRDVRETASQMTATLHDMLFGAREIQGYRAEEAALAKFEAVNRSARRASQRSFAPGAIFFPFVEFLSVAAFIIVLWYGGHRVLAGQLDIGTFTAFLLYLGLLFGPVYGLSEFWDTAQAALAGGRRIGSVLAMEPAIAESSDPVPLRSPRGEFRLTGIRFSYPRPDGATGPEVLRGIELDVPAGQTLALVGVTGAGKSTIAGLLLRFHDPVAGRITLDGIDLRQIRMADLRGAISFVPQEGFLFAGTVADNIRFGRPQASMSEIEDALTALGAWRLIGQLPSGLDTPVGERGSMLAEGERQVIALARAWITAPAVLVLDEATSHLDPDTESAVSLALRRLRAGRTTVLIAHRLSSVLEADLIAVVEDGRIAEAGPPSQLIAEGGRFAELYDRWKAAAQTLQSSWGDANDHLV